LSKIIVKSNALISAKYRLSLNEQRLILYVLAEKISKFDNDFGIYTVSRTELEMTFGDGMSHISELKDILTKLNSRKISFFDGKKWIVASWISAAEVDEGGTDITIEFPKLLKPYLLELKEKFTKYGLENIIYLKSSHSIRLYELLKQRVRLKNIIFPVDELKEILGIGPEEYRLFGHFKDKVLNVAQKQINENSDIRFTFTPIKKGRKFTSIKFTVKASKISRQQQLPTLETPPFNDQELFDNLISFGATPTQAESYFKKYSVEHIKRNLDYCIEYDKQGKITQSKRGFLKSAISEDYGFVDVAGEKHKEEERIKALEKAELNKQAEAEEEKALEIFNDLKEEKSFEIFNRLPKTEQNKILKHIEDNLSEFMRPRFKAEGVNNILIKRSNFIPHMVDYYIPELADFDKWNSK
jgi:plasmid replication initiation protein